MFKIISTLMILALIGSTIAAEVEKCKSHCSKCGTDKCEKCWSNYQLDAGECKAIDEDTNCVSCQIVKQVFSPKYQTHFLSNREIYFYEDTKCVS